MAGMNYYCSRLKDVVAFDTSANECEKPNDMFNACRLCNANQKGAVTGTETKLVNYRNQEVFVFGPQAPFNSLARAH